MHLVSHNSSIHLLTSETDFASWAFLKKIFQQTLYMIQFFKFWPLVRQNQPHYELLGHPAKVKLVANNFYELYIPWPVKNNFFLLLHNDLKILPDKSSDQVSKVLANHQTKSVLSRIFGIPCKGEMVLKQLQYAVLDHWNIFCLINLPKRISHRSLEVFKFFKFGHLSDKISIIKNFLDTLHR